MQIKEKCGLVELEEPTYLANNNWNRKLKKKVSKKTNFKKPSFSDVVSGYFKKSRRAAPNRRKKKKKSKYL